MTRMLASVTGPAEAETAVAGGADIIDLKDPSRGALGAVPVATVARTVIAIRGRRETSAVTGDLPMQPELVAAAARAMAWPAFADLLEQAFRRDGHEVRRLNAGAVDFELQRKGKTLLVSARRWKSARTGLEPLRELQAAREKADAAALYVGLGEISEPAAAFAAQHRIAFWQTRELAEAWRPHRGAAAIFTWHHYNSEMTVI